jgi:hypothetical protein
VSAPLESYRVALTQQLGALRAPPQDAAPEAVEGLWRGTQQRMAALEWTNEALKAFDPARTNARHFEMRALAEKVAELWQPYVDSGFGRRDRVR